MNQGFLPVCRKDMEERGWDAVDFAYVIGDAYVDHHRLARRSSAGFWRQMDTGWESFPSRTGKIIQALWNMENRNLDF